MVRSKQLLDLLRHPSLRGKFVATQEAEHGCHRYLRRTQGPRHRLPPHDLDGFLATFARSIDDPGIGLASLRAKALPAAALRELATRCLSMAKTQRPELLLLLHGAVELARELGFDGAHLSATQLATLSARPLPESMWVFASCHSAEELALAQNLGADAATLSPVHPTTSHPRARALGWQRFARLARRSWLPCYALGGVTREDLTLARTAGAHGIAAIRGFWSG